MERVAEPKKRLLVAVAAAVKAELDRQPRHHEHGGGPIWWPLVAQVMNQLAPMDEPWDRNNAYSANRKYLAGRDREAIIASVDPQHYRKAVQHVLNFKGAPGEAPPASSKTAAPKQGAEEKGPTEPDIEADTVLRKLQRKLHYYKTGYEKLLNQRADTEMLMETVREAIDSVDPIEPANIPGPTILLWNRPRVIMPLCSDLHGGEKVDGSKLKGFNEYNFDVLDERIDRWCTGVEEHFQHERAAGPVERIDLPLLGDIITGENIHRGQWMHIEVTAMRQIFMTAERVNGAILRLLKLGVPIHLHGVGGNHGRMGKKGESDFSNDFILYQYLMAKLERQPNLTFDFDWAFWTTVRYWDWRFYMCHGDNIRGWGGFPWYGQARADANTQMLMLTTGQWYHFFIHGHFHTDMSLQTPIGKRFANGNWVGTTEYGVNGGFGGRPSQKLLVITEKGGVESEIPIYLDEIDPDFLNRTAAGHGLGRSDEPGR